MTKIVTGLNQEGQKHFEAFIAAHAKPGVSTDYNNWWENLNFDDQERFHFELAGRYTSSGNPETMSLGSDYLETEDIE